jgi:hypothetical protein
VSYQIPALHFDHAAQEIFDGWLGDLEKRLRAGGEHEAFESHLAKYKKLMPALALLGHLVDSADGPITQDAFRQSPSRRESKFLRRRRRIESLFLRLTALTKLTKGVTDRTDKRYHRVLRH